MIDDKSDVLSFIIISLGLVSNDIIMTNSGEVSLKMVEAAKSNTILLDQNDQYIITLSKLTVTRGY
jgi:type III secretion system FlhB-like substrate exporter